MVTLWMQKDDDNDPATTDWMREQWDAKGQNVPFVSVYSGRLSWFDRTVWFDWDTALLNEPTRGEVRALCLAMRVPMSVGWHCVQV